MISRSSPLAKLYMFLRTARYLRWQQVAGRLWVHLYRPRLSDRGLPRRRPPRGRLDEPRFRAPSMTARDSFVLLNEKGRVKTAADWNDPEKDKLWLYNLHYFDDLNAHGAETRTEWHKALVRRWISENPPTKGNGWEPYPVSLRVVNWIKWDLRFRVLDQAAIHSVALQLRWLRRRLEYHILGNHLLANAKALIFGGLYFEAPEADEWLSTGWKILDRQIAEQVLKDGGHFERSPMYHMIVLEDLLDVFNILKVYGRIVPEHWLHTAIRMFEWADVMIHPDGQIPFFNDAAFGVAGTLSELRKYAERLSVPLSSPRSGSIILRESGYIRLQKGEAVAFFDAAPIGPDYLPAHGHADTLSLELSLFGRRLLVNSGTSVYGTGPERLRQRGTGAHNTIVVDGLDSSEVWGGFRVAGRARPRLVNFDLEEGFVSAEHDGYFRLPGKPLHRRDVRLTDRRLNVVDIVESKDPYREHQVRGAWHLHPDVRVLDLRVSGEANVVKLAFPTEAGEREAVLTLRGAADVRVEKSTWHPEFGLAVPNHRIVFEIRDTSPVMCETELRW